MNRFSAIPLFLFSILLFSCQENSKNEEVVEKENPSGGVEIVDSPSPAMKGNYVDDGYSKRGDGHDWVAVQITPLDKFYMRVSIRSRSDKKKPSCTYDTNALIVDENTLKTYENGKTVLFRIQDDSLVISTENKEDEGALYFFCSGGASIAGTYSKLDDELDKSQMDSRDYVKSLSLFDDIFILEARAGKLSIEVPGVEIDKGPYTHDLVGEVINAEVGDLNVDGSPEIFIYTKDAEGYGHLIAYSVNNGKSMSMVAVPELKDNADAFAGYEGNDAFAVVENSLVRRFPIEGGKKTRQIQYKLKDGEASRQLVVDKVIVY
ncbi:hypothetical protein [Echinicola shivajiensis]|uniref:hypothetical protein n=1 Tax=Echinicola shivajiensis TaxID=1035916 RepID=UPI001BFC9E1E|nr:hypothetical protein [Echinicola shivajiensis]